MFKIFLKLSQPNHLILAALTYTLGTGISHYLGRQLRATSFGLGMLAVLALLDAAFLFAEYFRLPLMPLEQGETPRHRELFRVTIIQVAFAALTLSAVATLTLILTHSLNIYTGLLLTLAFFFMVAYAVPPLRLSEAGYGELVLAVYLGTLLPALAFLLQHGRIHRLLTLTTFPLTLLAVAYFLVCNFPTFATDQKRGRRSLLSRLTWQNAVPIHHFLVLAAFLLFAITPFMNYPWGLIWPVFLVLPFAAIQIFWLQHIASGGRTLWTFLDILANATFGLTVYLLTLTFWIR